ncbi:MAG: ketoacyl-ACP synthase III [Actinomycetota bacterium]|nr:ketoacyl-ACP synthase III [Actinomycetota bacterium]
MVFPSSYFPDLDFSAFETLLQFEGAVQRDFEDKAPTGTDIAQRIDEGGYANRFELLRDLGLNLFWVNRYSLTMYEKRPTRWRDVPKMSDDVYLPVVTPWEDGERKVAAVEAAYQRLPPAWDQEVEDRIFSLLFDVFRHRRHHATELPALKPTVAELLQRPGELTFCIPSHDPDYQIFSEDDILDHQEEVAELESLGRWARVLHNQYPWDRSATRLVEVGQLDADDFVIVFTPRTRDVRTFIRQARREVSSPEPAAPAVETRRPVRPYPPVDVRRQFAIMPKIESLSAIPGEHSCSNDDVIRNSAFNWSPMSASEIERKTGIKARAYSERPLEHLALDAARAALAKAGRVAEEIGAVFVCTCTSTRLVPSMATWISGELGIFQTHASCDLVAACAGFAYGLSEAVRVLQEVDRPILVVFAEKFSDKIGSVRTSRMLFGDGAAAMVIGPAPDGVEPDLEVLQTYASGPVSEVNSIIWPNPEFDGNLTVYGPEVKALVERYLAQMIDEIKQLPARGGPGSLLDEVDGMVPHQANKVMVSDIAEKAGIPAERVYFNIEWMGNVSAASIPVALRDAVAEGVVDRPMRLFCPGFGAGAVGGYVVLRLDPAVVVLDGAEVGTTSSARWGRGTSSEDVRIGFA